MNLIAWNTLRLGLLTAIMAMVGCASNAQSTEGFTTIHGTATYRQRIAMPGNALLTVTLEETVKDGATANVLAKTQENFGDRQVPIAFSLNVPSNALQTQGQYYLRATISTDGELRFVTTKPYALPEAAQSIELMLNAANPGQHLSSPAKESDQAQLSSATLRNTYWKLIALDGKPLPPASNGRADIHITLSSQDSRVTGFSGCNQLMGSYVLKDNALHFSQLAGTLMACDPASMELESLVLKALGSTTAYRVVGEQLLLLNGEQTLARFEAVYLR